MIAPVRRLLAATVGWLALSAFAPPVPAQYVQFATTEIYLAADEAVREAYIAGMVDTLLAHNLAPDWLSECVSTLWLRTHPLEHRFSLPTTFVTAMERYCSREVPW